MTSSASAGAAAAAGLSHDNTPLTGRVVGVRATRFGQDITVRAERGVVLATGSFAYPQQMIENHAPRLIGRPAAATYLDAHDPEVHEQIRRTKERLAALRD